MNLYSEALRALHAGRLPVFTPGIDSDGDVVLCLSKFRTTRSCERYTRSDDPGERAAFVLGVVEVAREGLRERHGIRC